MSDSDDAMGVNPYEIALGKVVSTQVHAAECPPVLNLRYS